MTRKTVSKKKPTKKRPAPKPFDGTCPKCHCENLTLSEQVNADVNVLGYDRELKQFIVDDEVEYGQGDTYERMWCINCGKYFPIPKGVGYRYRQDEPGGF